MAHMKWVLKVTNICWMWQGANNLGYYFGCLLKLYIWEGDIYWKNEFVHHAQMSIVLLTLGLQIITRCEKDTLLCFHWQMVFYARKQFELNAICQSIGVGIQDDFSSQTHFPQSLDCLLSFLYIYLYLFAFLLFQTLKIGRVMYSDWRFHLAVNETRLRAIDRYRPRQSLLTSRNCPKYVCENVLSRASL